MDLSRGYNLPPSVQSRLRLLDWIGDNGGAVPGAFVELGPLFDGRDQANAQAIAANLEALEQEHLLRIQATLGWGGWSCDVLPAGVELIEKLRAARADLLGRRKALRDALLIWLHACTLRGNGSPTLGEFRRSPYGTYYGHEFTDDEINSATRWLSDEGLISGTLSYGGGVGRPVITTAGERVVESGRSVNADAQQPAPYSVTTVNVTGSGNNVATNATNVTQTTTVRMTTENARQLQGLAESWLSSPTPAFSASMRTRLRKRLSSLRASARPPSRTRCPAAPSEPCWTRPRRSPSPEPARLSARPWWLPWIK